MRPSSTISWTEQNPEIGDLQIELLIDMEHSKICACFSLVARCPFFLRKCQMPGQMTLDYESYQARQFREGESMVWQSITSLKEDGEQWTEEWSILVEKDGKTVLWEIPPKPITILPRLELQHDITYKSQIACIRLQFQNKSQQDLADLCVQVRMKTEQQSKDSTISFLSGPSTAYIKLSMSLNEGLSVGHISETLLYTSRASGTMEVEATWQKKLLLQEAIPICIPIPVSKTKTSVKMDPDNKNVSVVLRDASTKKKISVRHGYYYVNPDRELQLTINPEGLVSNVKDIIFTHPNLSVSNLGTMNDKEFSYAIKFLTSEILTSKLLVLYTVRYANNHDRSQILAFKVRGDIWKLFVAGLIFALPTILDMSTDVLGWNKKVILVLTCLCVLIPWIYDQIQRKF